MNLPPCAPPPAFTHAHARMVCTPTLLLLPKPPALPSPSSPAQAPLPSPHARVHTHAHKHARARHHVAASGHACCPHPSPHPPPPPCTQPHTRTYKIGLPRVFFDLVCIECAGCSHHITHTAVCGTAVAILGLVVGPQYFDNDHRHDAMTHRCPSSLLQCSAFITSPPKRRVCGQRGLGGGAECKRIWAKPAPPCQAVLAVQPPSAGFCCGGWVPRLAASSNSSRIARREGAPVHPPQHALHGCLPHALA